MNAAASPAWAQAATLHIHMMAPWWAQLHDRPARRRVRVEGDIAFMPPPVAGYRIRHDGPVTLVEIKPSRAPAIVLGRFGDAAAARALLEQVSAEHARPFLGEIGKAA